LKQQPAARSPSGESSSSPPWLPAIFEGGCSIKTVFFFPVFYAAIVRGYRRQPGGAAAAFHSPEGLRAAGCCLSINRCEKGLLLRNGREKMIFVYNFVEKIFDKDVLLMKFYIILQPLISDNGFQNEISELRKL
jgi:hypothetical protein